MYYFVIGTDGQQYGPADIDTLVAWVGEGRVVASTVLIERGSDRQLRADSLAAVAAAIRRATGQGGPVVVERPMAGATELPTMTQVPQAMPRALPPVPASSGFPQPYAPMQAREPRSRLTAGLLGIFLGWLGVHRFYLGYVGIGVLQIVATFCCGIGFIGGFVEGILCLCGGIRDADGNDLV